MSDLPEKIVRFDAVRIEYGKRKMCQCYSPHYEIDYQNKMVYCLDCGAIVDPLEALMRIAKDTKRWDDYTQERLEQRRQIMNYQPRRVVIKKLEKQYVKTGETLYGQYVEILSGLTMDDNIAFPYGKDVKEGAKVELSENTDNIIY